MVVNEIAQGAYCSVLMIYSFIWSLKSGWKTFSDSFFFRKCTCWQSIPLGYDLECVTSSTAKLLNSSFNNNEIPHLPLEHFPPELPYWCCTSCFCGEREKKGMKEKIKWMSRDQCQRFDQHHVSNLSLILTLCDLIYKWWVVHFSFNIKTSVGQFIS